MNDKMVETIGQMLGEETEGEKDKSLDFICRPALSVLLLLNSRSRILKTIDPVKNLTRINKARVKSGKEEIVSMGSITFDVARYVKSGKSENDIKIEMAAALVRGHFKVRQTGVFFWSPHVRNARDDEHKASIYAAEINSERRHTIKTGPAGLPVQIPGLDPV